MNGKCLYAYLFLYSNWWSSLCILPVAKKSTSRSRRNLSLKDGSETRKRANTKWQTTTLVCPLDLAYVPALADGLPRCRCNSSYQGCVCLYTPSSPHPFPKPLCTIDTLFFYPSPNSTIFPSLQMIQQFHILPTSDKEVDIRLRMITTPEKSIDLLLKRRQDDAC